MAKGGRGPKASLLHATPGRLRLRIDAFVGDAAAMEAFVESIAEVPGLTRIVGRPATGTLILEYAGEVADLVPALVETGGMTFVRPPTPPPLSQTLRFGLALIDQRIAARTEGAIDGRTGIALVLGGLAVFQAAQGRLLGPASTLLMGALALLDPVRKG